MSGVFKRYGGMKQTPVEWYFTELWSAPKDKFIWHSILIKAKEMEKQQIKDAFETGDFENTKVYTADQYYNKTYGKK
jgi:hypothetical protein